MKIAQLLLSPAIGGAEKSFIDLCNGLSGKQEVVALVPRGVDYADRFLPGIKLCQLTSSPSRNNPFLAIEIGRILRQERVDILHAHSAKATQVARRITRFLNIPFTATKRNTRKGRIFDLVEHVIAISEGVSKTIDNPSVRVIYNGIDPIPFHPSGPASGPFRIGAYGRLDPVKGFDRLIRAVHRPGFDCRLELHGTGPEQQRLERLIATLGLQDQVSLQGYTEDIAASMDGCHLIVVSSHSEGFCRVLVEAAYYAHTLLSTRVGIAEQLLTDEFLVEGDRIREKITQMHDRYPEMQVKFHRIKEAAWGRFTVGRMVDAHLAYYRTLL